MNFNDRIDGNFIRERITQLRLQKNVSEREMSLDMGRGHGYIHNIVSGASLPTMESFLEICEYFHVTLMEFFDYELSNPVDAKEIYYELKRLCKNDTEKLLNLLKVMNLSHFQAIIDFLENYRLSVNQQQKHNLKK